MKQYYFLYDFKMAVKTFLNLKITSTEIVPKTLQQIKKKINEILYISLSTDSDFKKKKLKNEAE